MDQRLYPVSPAYFDQYILPLIEGSYIWKGRPPTISHYQVFCAILYVLRTGAPWRDLPACYGKWHPIYLRFRRGSERGVWWHILITLQQHKQLRLKVVLVDSTTWKVHRHGGGQKGGSAAGAAIGRG
jgi:transposase